jgi:hypothetical protein
MKYADSIAFHGKVGAPSVLELKIAYLELLAAGRL